MCGNHKLENLSAHKSDRGFGVSMFFELHGLIRFLTAIEWHMTQTIRLKRTFVFKKILIIEINLHKY